MLKLLIVDIVKIKFSVTYICSLHFWIISDIVQLIKKHLSDTPSL